MQGLLKMWTFELFLLTVILGAVTYRVARFIVLDTLIDGTRDKAQGWLEARIDKLAWRKLLELSGCPWCITVWVAGAATLATRIFVGSFPMPVWVWLGAATWGLVFWKIIDSED